jgi:hypothetical protein
VAIAVYTPAQREAVVYNVSSLGLSRMRTAQLAADGLLEHPSGATLQTFNIPVATVRTIVRRERLRRERRNAELSLLLLEPRDAAELLRRRLIGAIDGELTRMEIEQSQGDAVSGEQLRQVARALRELAALPDAADPRPPAPGTMVDGVRVGGRTRGGIAGAAIRSSRSYGLAVL